MTEDPDGARFLAAFGDLKAAVGDSPEQLSSSWEKDERLPKLCDELSDLVRSFEIQEEWSPFPFTHHVSAAATIARRDYDERWRPVVGWVAARDIHFLLKDLLPDTEKDDEPQKASRDQLGEHIDDWKDLAKEDSGVIEHLIDFAISHREVDECGDLDWVDESVRAWDRLKVAGLDIRGALWRKRAIPHVLVPSHVAKHYGASRASLYRRFHQAARAFIFGAPLAALALQRAVLEEVLRSHWGADERIIESAKLPELQWDARAARLKRMANEALHTDPERQTPEQLDRSIIENFLLLRLLIEHAPENLAQHRGS